MLTPTGSLQVRMDGWGSGMFGAPRDDGARDHRGLDLKTYEGQELVAPISGAISVGRPYEDDDTYHIVNVAGDGIVVRLFYAQPVVSAGQRVRRGQVIATAQDVSRRYNDRPEAAERGAMLAHIHFEVVMQVGHAIGGWRKLKRNVRVDPLPLLELT